MLTFLFIKEDCVYFKCELQPGAASAVSKSVGKVQLDGAPGSGSQKDAKEEAAIFFHCPDSACKACRLLPMQPVAFTAKEHTAVNTAADRLLQLSLR